MKINFYPTKTLVYKAGGVKKLAESFLFRLIKFFLIVLSLLAIADLIFIYLQPSTLNNLYFGWSLIILGLSLISLAFNYYYRGFLLQPEIFNLLDIEKQIDNNQEINFWRLFSVELSNQLLLNNINLPKSDSRKIALALLKSNEIKKILIRLALPESELTKILQAEENADDRINEIFTRALKIARAENHQLIEIGDLFLALILFDPTLKKIFFQLKIEPADFANVIYWQTKVMSRINKEKKIFNTENLLLTGGIGRDWAYGYTLTLEKFSTDLSEEAKSGGFSGLELEAKDHEINLIEQSLSRGQNHNVIIVGDTGVGKKTTVYGLAKKIYSGQTNSLLKNRRMLELDIESILSGSNNPNELVEKIRIIFSEAAYAGNIILFIENFTNLVSGGDKIGRVDALEVLIPYLSSPNIYVIGTASERDFKNFFAPNQKLGEAMVKVELHEPSFDETVRIVEDSLAQIEGKNQILVSYEAIKEAINLSDRYQQNLAQPQKSITLIDQAATKKSSDGGGILMPHDLDEIIEIETKVPVGDLENNEKQILLKLEDEMHKRVIGQKEAVSAIADALRRVRAGVTKSNKPIGSFIFLGPTGVGKTETAKTLAALYYKSEAAMIRFDMSEFQQKSDIYRLIGDPNDESNQGMLTGAIRERPFSLLLFDEIEKAHPDILNLFLQVLDEGSITDAFGQKSSFSSAIIIFTSNAGSEYIRQAVSKGLLYPQLQKGLIDFVQKENLFRPELLNRFSGVIVFRPLTLPEITEVAKLMITKLAITLKKDKGITISVDESAVSKLAQLGYNPEMGARPMQRALEEHLENALAKRILSGEVNRGDSVTIGPNDLE